MGLLLTAIETTPSQCVALGVCYSAEWCFLNSAGTKLKSWSGALRTVPGGRNESGAKPARVNAEALGMHLHV